MKLRLLTLATLLAVTGCAADPEATSSRQRPERAVERPARSADAGDTSTPSAPAPSAPATSEAATSETADEDSSGAGSFAAAVYYLGDTDRAGVRLYREFRPGSGDRLGGTLELVMSAPLDPDYRTAWQPGTLQDAAVVGAHLEVVTAPGLSERPAGMSAADARQAIQQVVYSLQAAVQERLPVRFTTDSGPMDRVLGVATPGAVRQGSPLQVLSHVSLTSPEQGAATASTLRVSGVGNSFEANLGWEIRQGDRVVKDGFATMDGWMGDQLFPFQTTVDVSGLEPGSYTLRVTTDDPAGGAEGVGAMTDDREFTVG